MAAAGADPEIDALRESLSGGRYARQLILPGFGPEGQERLARSRVLLLGAGGLGGVVAQYLVRAGVGRLMVVDCGCVDMPDLNRQLLFGTRDLGARKADVAAVVLREVNPDVEVQGFAEEITRERLPAWTEGADLVVDALDNFPTRLLANEACCASRRILVHGGIHGTRGVASTVVPGKGPCLWCVYEGHNLERPKTPFPVLGPTPGVIASIQAMEALHVLLGGQPSLCGRMLLFNGRSMNFSYRPVERRMTCPACGGVEP